MRRNIFHRHLFGAEEAHGTSQLTATITTTAAAAAATTTTTTNIAAATITINTTSTTTLSLPARAAEAPPYTPEDPLPRRRAWRPSLGLR